MTPYSGFAELYDIFMDNVPYEEWAEYLIKILEKHGVKCNGTDRPILLEMGCGTGRMTRLLAKSGFDMIGIDSSEEMLMIARDKNYEDDSIDSILYLEQDMRELELYGTVAAVISICDSMNYITSPEDMLKVFKLVNNYLDPGGIFIFDINTMHKYKDILSDGTFAENRDNCSFIWENDYDEETQLNTYDLTLYAEDEETGQYDRYEEFHIQRAYEISEIRELAEEAGLVWVRAFDELTFNIPHNNSERIFIVLKEQGK